MYFKTYAQPDSFEHKRWTLVTVKCMVLMEACIKEESIIVCKNQFLLTQCSYSSHTISSIFRDLKKYIFEDNNLLNNVKPMLCKIGLRLSIKYIITVFNFVYNYNSL